MTGTVSNGCRGLALVTGASSGIGREIACLLSRRGHSLIVAARRLDELDALARELSPTGVVHTVSLDLSDPGAIEPALSGTFESHGWPEVVVNCAGYGLYKPFLSHSDADHRGLMQVNYFAPLAITRLALPEMLRRGRGHVINIASMSTKVGPWGHSGYAAAKCALVSLTQTLAAEHARGRVRFSYVNPGIVSTNYFAMPSFEPLFRAQRKRAISPRSVAEATVALLDRPRLEVCVPWHYRALDWLIALSPALALRIVAAECRRIDAPVVTAVADSDDASRAAGR